MWYRLDDVANSRRLDEQSLLEFALDNESKYNIVLENVPMISTWFVDDFVKDFKIYNSSK